jgi:hypothetical protein
VNTYLPPQSTKEKFTSFAQDSFDYSSFIFVGLLSGVQQLQGSSPEFHTGPAAYGRYYWHSFADQTDENLWVEFLIPAALHEDARYYTLGSWSSGVRNGPEQAGATHSNAKHNGALKRTVYASREWSSRGRAPAETASILARWLAPEPRQGFPICITRGPIVAGPRLASAGP